MPDQGKRNGQAKKKYVPYESTWTKVLRVGPTAYVIGVDKGSVYDDKPAMEFKPFARTVNYHEIAMRNLAYWIHGNIEEGPDVKQKSFEEIANNILGAMQSAYMNNLDFLKSLRRYTFDRYYFIIKEHNVDLRKGDYELLSLQTLNYYAARKLNDKIKVGKLSLVLPTIEITKGLFNPLVHDLEAKYCNKVVPNYKHGDLLKKTASWFMTTVIKNAAETSDCQKIQKILWDSYKGTNELKTFDQIYAKINEVYASNEYGDDLREAIKTYKINHIYFTTFLFKGFLEPIGEMINAQRLLCKDAVTITKMKLTKNGIEEWKPHIIWESSDERTRFTAVIPWTLYKSNQLAWHPGTIVFNTAVKDIPEVFPDEFFSGFVNFIFRLK